MTISGERDQRVNNLGDVMTSFRPIAGKYQ